MARSAAATRRLNCMSTLSSFNRSTACARAQISGCQVVVDALDNVLVRRELAAVHAPLKDDAACVRCHAPHDGKGPAGLAAARQRQVAGRPDGEEARDATGAVLVGVEAVRVDAGRHAGNVAGPPRGAIRAGARLAPGGECP